MHSPRNSISSPEITDEPDKSTMYTWQYSQQDYENDRFDLCQIIEEIKKK